jgi:fibronectin type 3 domain-containing protein
MNYPSAFSKGLYYEPVRATGTIVILMRGGIIGLATVVLALAIGTSSPSAQGASADAQPPGTPQTTMIGSTEIDLSWSAPTDDPTPDYYIVYQGTSTGTEVETPDSPVFGTTDAIIGLTPDTTYYFYVTAVLHGAPSPNSQEISVTTLCSAPQPPAWLNATVNGTEADLSWGQPASGSTPDYYRVYEGTSSGGESPSPVFSTDGLNAAIPGLSRGTTYWFGVLAFDACGDNSEGIEKSVTLPAAPGKPGPPGQQGKPGRQGPAGQGTVRPTYVTIVGGTRHIGSSRKAAPPLSLIVTAVRGSTVDLSWTRPSGRSVVDGYNVYLGTRPGRENIAAPANPVTITRTTYTVTGLTPRTTYYFRVTTVDNAQHESSPSNEAHATTLLTPARHPAVRARGTGQPWLTIAIGPVGLLAVAIGGALLLARLRSRRAAAKATRAATGPVVRAVPNPGPPTTATVRPTGSRAAGPSIIRIVPKPGTSSITTERALPS